MTCHYCSNVIDDDEERYWCNRCDICRESICEDHREYIGGYDDNAICLRCKTCHSCGEDRDDEHRPRCQLCGKSTCYLCDFAACCPTVGKQLPADLTPAKYMVAYGQHYMRWCCGRSDEPPRDGPLPEHEPPLESCLVTYVLSLAETCRPILNSAETYDALKTILARFSIDIECRPTVNFEISEDQWTKKHKVQYVSRRFAAPYRLSELLAMDIDRNCGLREYLWFAP